MSALRLRRIVPVVLLLVSVLSACSWFDRGSGYETRTFKGGRGALTLRILAADLHEIAEPVLEEFTKRNKVTLELSYTTSGEISRVLEEEVIPFDAVWPAANVWIALGDLNHRTKHQGSIYTTPVIYGLPESHVSESGQVDPNLSWAFPGSQTQAGLTAQLALAGSPVAESSTELSEQFLQGGFDGLVTYESLFIGVNRELLRQGKDTLMAYYPAEAVTLATAPLAFVSANGEEKRDEAEVEEAYLKLLAYLLSEPVQKALATEGARTGSRPEMNDPFRPDWGLDRSRIITARNLPAADELRQLIGSE